MNIVIIPSHNQSKHIENIIKAYEKQTLSPDLLIFVLDRCEDDSEDILKNVKSELNIEYVIKSEGVNFDAGHTRDYGLKHALSRYDNFNVIFTDGDCIPSEVLVEKHVENLNNEYVTVSVGPRELGTPEGDFLPDPRTHNDKIADGSFTDINGRVVINRKYWDITYSCNLAMNYRAVKELMFVNLELTGESRLFNSEFDGKWGGEDNFVGMVTYTIGGLILLTSKDACVYHQWHESKMNNVDLKEQFSKARKMIDKLVSYIIDTKKYDCLVKVKNSNVNLYGVDGLNNIRSLESLENVVERVLPFVIEETAIEEERYLTFVRIMLSRCSQEIFSQVPSVRLYFYGASYISDISSMLSSVEIYFSDGKFSTNK